jgi:hypothetical protein
MIGLKSDFGNRAHEENCTVSFRGMHIDCTFTTSFDAKVIMRKLEALMIDCRSKKHF